MHSGLEGSEAPLTIPLEEPHRRWLAWVKLWAPTKGEAAHLRTAATFRHGRRRVEADRAAHLDELRWRRAQAIYLAKRGGTEEISAGGVGTDEG